MKFFVVFFFYVTHGAQLMSNPTALAQRSAVNYATRVESKGFDTANNKVHRCLTLHGRLNPQPLTFSSAISETT